MKVSVIIPALNEAEHLLGTIQACLRNDAIGSVHEIIVCDGGSTDDTSKVAISAGARCIESERSGRAVQMNTGASVASGDILMFLHADTQLPSNWTSHIHQAVEEGHLAGCFRLSFGHSSPWLRLYGWVTRFDMDFMRFGDQGLFIVKDAFRELGGYREDHRVLEDNELTRRIRANKLPFKVMAASAVTSPRRYLDQGILRLQIIFTVIYLRWRMGASQDELVAYYRRKVSSRVPE